MTGISKAIRRFISNTASFNPIQFPSIMRSTIIPSLLILSGMLTIAKADTFGDFTYGITNSAVTITGYTGPGGNVIIPDVIEGKTVTGIGVFAFGNCINLTGISIPTSVTIIGDQAFYSCENLTEITIPNSVVNVGYAAFENCFSLTNATIGCNVVHLGETFGCPPSTPFRHCLNLRNITMDALNPAFCCIDGVLFNKARTTLIQCLPCKKGDYVIPAGVTTTWAWAFCDCTSLTSVTVPPSFLSFHISTFLNCPSLQRMFFEGNAPAYNGAAEFDHDWQVVVYYRAGTTGWQYMYSNQPTMLWIEQPTYQDWVGTKGLQDKFPDACGQSDDPDHDGMSNLQEWLAGTNPTDAYSVLTFQNAPHLLELADPDRQSFNTNQQYALYFQTIPGKQYKIESVSAFGGTWQTETNAVATTTQKRILVNKPADQRFYRIIIVP
jgi:hypothetical protein